MTNIYLAEQKRIMDKEREDLMSEIDHLRQQVFSHKQEEGKCTEHAETLAKVRVT